LMRSTQARLAGHCPRTQPQPQPMGVLLHRIRGEADGAGEREDYLAAVRIEICGEDERRQGQIYVRVRAPRPRCLDAEPFGIRDEADVEPATSARSRSQRGSTPV
jgi:hypothetical protein